eukprot:10636292-Prorocentrum_lima.AAC.1
MCIRDREQTASDRQVPKPRPPALMLDKQSGPDKPRAELEATWLAEQRRNLAAPEQAEDQAEIYRIVQGWDITKQAQVYAALLVQQRESGVEIAPRGSQTATQPVTSGAKNSSAARRQRLNRRMHTDAKKEVYEQLFPDEHSSHTDHPDLPTARRPLSPPRRERDHNSLHGTR